MKYINKLIPIILFSVNAFSYETFLNSPSLLNGNEYDLSATSKFFSGKQKGAHLIGTIDLPFTQETNLRFYGGIASLDFSIGGSLKWIPVKINRKNQFNFGGVISAEYKKDNKTNAFLLRTTPFISKEFSWELGFLQPYIALPLGVLATDSTSRITSQFVIGSKIKFDSITYMSFSTEGGFDIKNTDSYLAIMATVLLGK